MIYSYVAMQPIIEGWIFKRNSSVKDMLRTFPVTDCLKRFPFRKAWEPWFANHGNFRFVEEETFIEEKEQKVLYRRLLEWPSLESGHEGRPEKRRGVDVIHFKDGKIMNKLTYSKTTIEIDGQRRSLHL